MGESPSWRGPYFDDDGVYNESSGSGSDSDGISSEIEFQLYGQVHYSSELIRAPDDGEKDNAITETEGGAAVSEKDLGVLHTSGGKNVDFWVKMTGIDIFKDWKNTPETAGGNSGIDPQFEVQPKQPVAKPDKEKSEKLDKEDLQKLKRYLSESSDAGFSPESWEIVDSVESDDSDDAGVDIHVSHEKEPEKECPLWIPGQGPKSMWQIDDRDRRLIFPGERSRYYADPAASKMRCRNCNEAGHKANSCPEPKKQQVCFQCGNRGHLGRECPDNVFTRGRGRECNRCGQGDHIQADCPDLWRQFHVTTKQGPIVVPKIPIKLNENICCYLCATEGHFGYECEEGPWSYHTVLAPLVQRYDRHIIVGDAKDLRTKLKGKTRKFGKDSKISRSKEKDDFQAKDDAREHRSKKTKNATNFFQSAARAVGAKIAHVAGKKDSKKARFDEKTDVNKSNDNFVTKGGKKRKHFENDQKDSEGRLPKKKKINKTYNEHYTNSSHCDRRVVSVAPKKQSSSRQLDQQKSQRNHGRKVIFQTDRDDQPFPRTPRQDSSFKQREVRFGNKQKWRKNEKFSSKRDAPENDRGFRKRFGWRK